MGAPIFMIILGGMFIYFANNYRKARKFYLKNGVELQGEVVFWEKRKGWHGQKNFPYYVMKVRANGQDYYLETDNSKARKYKNRTDVTIVTPEEQSLPSELVSEYRDKPVLDDIQQKLQELNSMSHTRMTILKDEMPTVGQYIFIGAFGGFLMLIGIISLCEPLLRKIL